MNDKQLTVGNVLKKRRQTLRLSLAQVEVATKIRGKYLVEVESGDYSHLPNDIYTRGFVYNYADFLGLNAENLARQYVAERGGKVESSAKKLKPLGSKRLIVTPKIMVAAVLLIVAGLVVAYVGWQFQALAAPPKLTIDNPTTDQVLYGALADVGGQVDGGADVFINDSPILTDQNGRFSDKLALQDGVNTIKITAKNKIGKVTTVSRNILAHVPKVEGTQAAVPNATFDGLAVGVTIKGAATWLIVEVDGREAFRGTMLEGTSQTFRGSKVKLTAGNAGSTNLLITNSIVANKSLSPIGKDGEIKRDLEFAKDTNFQ